MKHEMSESGSHRLIGDNGENSAWYGYTNIATLEDASGVVFYAATEYWRGTFPVETPFTVHIGELAAKQDDIQ